MKRTTPEPHIESTTRPCGPRCERIERSPGCIQAALRVIGDKWTPFLIARLVDAPHTFGELSELLPGISPRTLSARLRRLEDEGILERRQYEDRPVRFRYALTKKGTALTDLLTQMAAWGEKYR
jgi:DNA-binding HxlR family transcriptional regulator